MSKVYLAVAGAPDQLLGHVDESGEVSRHQLGLDTVVGHVNLTTGDIYEQRFGPDKKVGHVDLSSGRVYISRFGPDEHVGQVAEDGRMNLHKALAADDYVGNVDQVLSRAHSAGAMVLLVLPALEPDKPIEVNEEKETVQ